MLNAGVVPVVPQLGSVGASGDLAPLSHLAIVLLGGGEAFSTAQRMPVREACARGLAPRVAVVQGRPRAQQRHRADAGDRAYWRCRSSIELLDTADLAAAMTIDAFAGRMGAFAPEVHALRRIRGRCRSPQPARAACGSTLADIPYHLVPKFRQWLPSSWDAPGLQQLRFDIGWDWVPLGQRHGREKFYQRFRPFRGGKKAPAAGQLFAALHPQVHGAVRDAVEQAKRCARHRTECRHRQSAGVPGCARRHVEQQVISAGHFHGMPLALAMSTSRRRFRCWPRSPSAASTSWSTRPPTTACRRS
jgi:histidine ammonia-lyase